MTARLRSTGNCNGFLGHNFGSCLDLCGSGALWKGKSRWNLTLSEAPGTCSVKKPEDAGGNVTLNAACCALKWAHGIPGIKFGSARRQMWSRSSSSVPHRTNCMRVGMAVESAFGICTSTNSQVLLRCHLAGCRWKCGLMNWAQVGRPIVAGLLQGSHGGLSRQSFRVFEIPALRSVFRDSLPPSQVGTLS